MDPQSQPSQPPVQPQSTQPVPEVPPVPSQVPQPAQPSEPNEPVLKKGNPLGRVLFVFCIVVLFGLVIGISYYLGTQNKQIQPSVQEKAVVTKAPTVIPTPDITSQMATITATVKPSK